MNEIIDEMDLKSTVELMNSISYQDRFKAEYYQLLIRYKKLKKMTDDWDEGKLDFTPTCPRSLYYIQLKAMKNYLDTLRTRADIEKIDLNE